MTFVQGIDFRATSGYVTDAANEVETSSAANYPRTPSVGSSTGVGWEQSVTSTRDRSSSVDARLAGMHYRASAGSSNYRIDLPAAGSYTITLAIGDATTASTCTVELFDGTTSLGVVCSGAVLAGGKFVDAAGTTHNSAALWVTNQAPVTKTFATTIFRVKLTETSGNATLAHVRIAAVSGDATVNAVAATATASAAVPAVSASSGVTAVVASSTAASVAPVVSAGSSVVAVAASASGAAVAPSVTASSSVAPPAATATADAVAPTVGGTGDANVDAVAATATASVLPPSLSWSSSLSAAVATATAAALVPTVSGTANATVTAVAAHATAAAVAPSIFNGSPDATVDAVAATATADTVAPVLTVTIVTDTDASNMLAGLNIGARGVVSITRAAVTPPTNVGERVVKAVPYPLPVLVNGRPT